MSEPSHSDVLAHIQQHGREPASYRSQLAAELRLFAELLERHGQAPDGLTRAILGGAQHCINHLRTSFGFDISLERLCEIYADVELTSYPHSDEDIERMRQWMRSERLVLRLLPVPCPDGVTRHIFVSHQNQTSQNGKVYQEGEVVAACTRPVAPFEELLSH